MDRDGAAASTFRTRALHAVNDQRRHGSVGPLFDELLAGRLRVVARFDDETHCHLVATATAGAAHASALTQRETEVIRALRRGRSVKQVAIELGVAASTVATHLAHITSKLGLHSRLELILLLAQLPEAPDDR